MRVMEAHSVRRLSLVGLSYGGFVGYSMAAQSMEEEAAVAVERLVICCAAVCIEEKDLKEGVLSVSDLEEAVMILVPHTPARLRELMGYTLSRPPPLGLIPSCLLSDFIDVRLSLSLYLTRDQHSVSVSMSSSSVVVVDELAGFVF